jgi:hypothetical protein
MLSKTEIVLAAAITLSTAFTAAAATKQHRATPGHSAIHNTVPAIISDRCLPSGPPCRTAPDSW